VCRWRRRSTACSCWRWQHPPRSVRRGIACARLRRERLVLGLPVRDAAEARPVARPLGTTERHCVPAVIPSGPVFNMCEHMFAAAQAEWQGPSRYWDQPRLQRRDHARECRHQVVATLDLSTSRGCGETGIRDGFRSHWAQARGGSNPLSRTPTSRGIRAVTNPEARPPHVAGGRTLVDQRLCHVGPPAALLTWARHAGRC
jgi:hypothetical protein